MLFWYLTYYHLSPVLLVSDLNISIIMSQFGLAYFLDKYEHLLRLLHHKRNLLGN